MFKRILVPTDFGEPAQRALEIAIELAGKLGASVTLLHVYPIVFPVSYDEELTWPLEQIEKAAGKTLEAHLAKAKQRNASCEAILKAGSAAVEIVSVARQLKADLIVMGTHGRRGVSHLMLGSVAERVVRTAPVPVLTVGAAE
jgi:nucleotide-binding universal stress UspA family protein